VTGDLDLRLVRHFVAVAEELHFGRAAARLFVAQQSLSRDVARLERHVGTPLLVRSTRRVALTPEGERFLDRARQLLVLQDEALLDVRSADRPLVVDAVRDGTTAARVLWRARTYVEARHLEGRFHGGVGAALTALLADRVDVVFGRIGASQRRPTDHLIRRLVRLEPLGLIVPDDHPLAEGRSIPLAALAGLTIDTSAGNTDAPEWVDLATQLVEEHGAIPSRPHHPGMAAVAGAGPAETVHHVRRTGWPILTLLDVPPLPGAVVQPLVDPVPVYPWLVVHRPHLRHPGLDALYRAVDDLAEAEGWRQAPAGAWFAAGDRDLLVAEPASYRRRSP
jgi:DNA-binding transcriptional LysR family regulator